VELLICHGRKNTVHRRLPETFFSLSELCARFHISRKTAYKWIERYEAEGPSG